MTIELTVTDMSCGGCEQAVEDALADVPEVESAEADHEADRVTVEGNPDREAVVGAIEDAGYTVAA
ncbi:MAG TPA: heavy metal-associated domain-containing protein [Natrialbaceae archaeon]|nr:heavy metal-associated domain-containing protein [Natrialbaceae archaeon]